MLAFAPKGTIREVDIPDDKTKGSLEQVLECIFHYGQNDFQPRECYSVSVGDVAEVDGEYYECAFCGWEKISKEEFDKKEGNLALCPRRGC